MSLSNIHPGSVAWHAKLGVLKDWVLWESALKGIQKYSNQAVLFYACAVELQTGSNYIDLKFSDGVTPVTMYPSAVPHENSAFKKFRL